MLLSGVERERRTAHGRGPETEGVGEATLQPVGDQGPAHPTLRRPSVEDNDTSASDCPSRRRVGGRLAAALTIVLLRPLPPTPLTSAPRCLGGPHWPVNSRTTGSPGGVGLAAQPTRPGPPATMRRATLGTRGCACVVEDHPPEAPGQRSGPHGRSAAGRWATGGATTLARRLPQSRWPSPRLAGPAPTRLAQVKTLAAQIPPPPNLRPTRSGASCTSVGADEASLSAPVDQQHDHPPRAGPPGRRRLQTDRAQPGSGEPPQAGS